MNLPKMSESIIRAAAEPQSFVRGLEYYERGAISNTAIRDRLLMGDCEGTQEPYYQVQVELDETGIRSTHCTCRYDFGGLCKHTVALLLAYVRQPKQFVVRQEPSALLADLDREALIGLVVQLIRERPELYTSVEAAVVVPHPSDKGKKTRRRKVDPEIYRRQVIAILRSRDGMRSSEAYWHGKELIEQLRQVEESAIRFLDADDPNTALAILMALIEETGQNLDSIDDSDDDIGGYLQELGQPLAEAILSLEMSAASRDALEHRLEKQARYLSGYGIDDCLYLATQAAQRGWDDTQTPPPEARRTAGRPDEVDNEEEFEDEDYDEETDDEYASEDWRGNPIGDLTEAKLNVLQRQGRMDEYLALCQQVGRHLRYALMLCDLKRVPEAIAYAEKRFSTAEDAFQMAERLRRLGRVAESIALGERGLKLDGAKVQLAEWLGPIEEAQGRTQQALQAWRAAFAEHPSLHTYETLKRLAGTSWRKLQPQVMAALRKSHDELALAEILLFDEQWDEAIRLAERRDVWYTIIETVADGVIAHRPEWVAQMSIKQAERQMVDANSQHYPFAAAWLKRAKQAYEQLRQMRKWQAYLENLKEQYKRRPALQAHLRRL